MAQSAPLESDQAKVSIITLLHDRRRFIPLLKACVAAQTYPSQNIEWIIVDDGEDDLSETFDGSNELYIRLNRALNIGRKRQLACDAASGEFLVIFDDDDLHFPHRIERSVERLQRVGSRMVAGSSEMFLGDAKTGSVVKVGPYNKNHATAGTLAFRKEYLRHSSFRQSDKAGEEMHFLKNWTIPVVQLSPSDTIIALSHDENTISKSKFFKDAEKVSNLFDIFPDKEILDLFRNS